MIEVELGVFLTVVGIVLVILVVCGMLWIFDRPERKRRRDYDIRVAASLQVRHNHLELYQLVRELLWLQEETHAEIFPGIETLERARRLTSDYRQEIGP